MLKKMLLAAAALMALVALAVPTASATWTHNHQAIQQNYTETFTGEFLYQNATTGQVKCTTSTWTIEMLAGQTKGTVRNITCSNPTTNAHIQGGVAALCGGTTILHVLELTQHGTATIVTSPAGNSGDHTRDSTSTHHSQTEVIKQYVRPYT